MGKKIKEFYIKKRINIKYNTQVKKNPQRRLKIPLRKVYSGFKGTVIKLWHKIKLTLAHTAGSCGPFPG